MNLSGALKDSESVSKKELIDQELRQYATNALNENIRLQQLVTFLEAENHRLTIKVNFDTNFYIYEFYTKINKLFLVI